MKVSMVPFDAPSKQSNGPMIWPPGKITDLESPAARFLDHFGQARGHALMPIESRPESRGHSPADLRLGDALENGSDGSRRGRHHRCRLGDEPSAAGAQPSSVFTRAKLGVSGRHRRSRTGVLTVF